jgi:ubiquinone/menaquinone biosynthesis C-methylase UbiE
VGTGVNLPLYGPGARIVALDASRSMLESARQRVARAGLWAVQADVQHLPFADGSFETVSGSLLFCSVDDPARGLAEAWRALAAGGRLLLLEHTRGQGLGAWLTDLLHPLWYAWNGVCHLNRRTVQTVVAAGFHLMRDEAHALGILHLIEALKPATTTS